LSNENSDFFSNSVEIRGKPGLNSDVQALQKKARYFKSPLVLGEKQRTFKEKPLYFYMKTTGLFV